METGWDGAGSVASCGRLKGQLTELGCSGEVRAEAMGANSGREDRRGHERAVVIPPSATMGEWDESWW